MGWTRLDKVVEEKGRPAALRESSLVEAVITKRGRKSTEDRKREQRKRRKRRDSSKGKEARTARRRQFSPRLGERVEELEEG